MKGLHRQSAALPIGEEVAVLQLVRADKNRGVKRALALLRTVDAKKVGLALAGTLAVTGMVNTAGRYRFHRRIVSRELRRQLAEVHEKLDALEAQNETLRAELEKMRDDTKK